MSVIIHFTAEQAMEIMFEYFQSPEYLDTLPKPNIVKDNKDFEERLNKLNILLINGTTSSHTI